MHFKRICVFMLFFQGFFNPFLPIQNKKHLKHI